MSNTITRIPKPGDTGSDVIAIQLALNTKVPSAGLTLDGVFGAKTRAVLAAFQKSIGLEGTGIPAEKTISGLGLSLGQEVETPVASGGAVTTGHDPDEGQVPWYRRMFASCVIRAGQERQVASAVSQVNGGLSRYLSVAKRLGFTDDQAMIFAYVLGTTHFKEASCDFSGCLHNGDKVIGNGKLTHNVPAGRGPFATWEDSAVDAINMNGGRWAKLRAGTKDIGEILYAEERYNGSGYLTGAGKNENSPYLWACSNINDGYGKYVSDGNFDPNATTLKTVGAAVILKQFYDIGEFKCTGVVAMAPILPVEVPATPPPTPVASTLTRQMIADKIVEIIQRDVDAEMRETGGYNRGPRIDQFNKRTHVALGSPYCAAGGWCAIDDACKILGLKNPVPASANSQAYGPGHGIPAKYIRQHGTLGKKGDAGVLTRADADGHGHYTTLREDQVVQPLFKTVEYNTDGSGTHDGDGAYALTRSTVDRSRENSGKLFHCFTDIPQWVLDANKP